MRVSRLYVSIALQAGSTVELDDDSAHYLRAVLRLKKAAEVVLFNGQGGEFLCTVAEVHRKRVSVDVNDWQDRTVESPLQVYIGMSVSRGDRMDFAVQKAVELGANRITPLFSERCVVQLKKDKYAQRLQHWQKIAQHASEQSHRTYVPDMPAIEMLPDWVGQQQGLKIFLDPYAEKTLNRLTPEGGKVTLLTGPEGGFTDKEREIAKAAGFIPVSLGQRVLRTETASLAALSAVQMLWGDFG